MLIDAHVGHFPEGDAQQVVIVHVVLRVSEREVGAHKNTTADIVVKGDTGGKTIQLLLDDGTSLVVKTATDAERCFLATATDGDIVVLAESPLCDGIAPVGVVVVLLILRECGVVIDFRHIGRGVVVLSGVEVRFLEQHRVVVAVEQFVTLGEVCAGKLQRVGQFWRARYTALGGNFDDAIATQ